MRNISRLANVALCLAVSLALTVGCSSGNDPVPQPSGEAPPPPANEASLESMARGFQLYYRERVERAVLSFNRFAVVGGTGFGTVIDRMNISKSGSDYETVALPTDNNRIGTSTWMAYNAYRVFKSRSLELTLLRLFEGLVFFESVTGVPGLTSRQVFPGWTRTVDGSLGTVSLSRNGSPVVSPISVNPTLESEILTAFYSGVSVTHRENPQEFYFNYLPVRRPGRFAVTQSFSALPTLLRNSECCSSLMRTPAPHHWEGAFWGNHNSRDNLPDLLQGYLAALAATQDPDLPPEVKDAAERAVQAGRRVADLILSSDNNIMTIADQDPYGTLTISGTIRPHGEPENQDLGSMGVCSMSYLTQAMSSEGLTADVAQIPLPNSIDQVFFGSSDENLGIIECEIAPEVVCTSLADGVCSLPWSRLGEVPLLGTPLYEFFEQNPSLGPTFLAAFQNDFDDVVEAMVIIYHYAEIVGDQQLAFDARDQVFHLTTLMQNLGRLAYSDDASRLERQLYLAAIYQAQTQLPSEFADFADFGIADTQLQRFEDMLMMADTVAPALRTQGELDALIAEELDDASVQAVEDRYTNEYGTEPPIRVTATGYEARGTPLADFPWRDIGNPSHRAFGGYRLMQAMPLCGRANQVLDCTWAEMGCERADLNADRIVDAADVTVRDGLTQTTGCDDTNQWCGGADLDRNGTSDATDAAFLTAAQGCFY